MTKVSYSSPKAIESSKADILIERGKLKALPLEGNGILPNEVTIPMYSKESDRNAFLRLETLRLESNGRPREILFVELKSCGAKSCSAVEESTARHAESLANWRILPTGVEVSSVYFGDANDDGINDVLLLMSDGAGLMIYSEKANPPKLPTKMPAKDSASPKEGD